MRREHPAWERGEEELAPGLGPLGGRAGCGAGHRHRLPSDFHKAKIEITRHPRPGLQRSPCWGWAAAEHSPAQGRAADVSPGQGLPVDQLQHVSGDVKLEPLLPLQPLLQDEPGEGQSWAPRLPLQRLGAPGQHRLGSGEPGLCQGCHNGTGTPPGPRYLQTSSPKSVSSRVNMKSITTKRYSSCPTHVSQHWWDKQRRHQADNKPSPPL